LNPDDIEADFDKLMPEIGSNEETKCCLLIFFLVEITSNNPT